MMEMHELIPYTLPLGGEELTRLIFFCEFGQQFLQLFMLTLEVSRCSLFCLSLHIGNFVGLTLAFVVGDGNV